MTEFEIDTDEGRRPALDTIADAQRYRRYAADPDTAEYVVRVEWLDLPSRSPRRSARPDSSAIRTRCAGLRLAKWQHTVERLKAAFPGWNEGDSSANDAGVDGPASRRS